MRMSNQRIATLLIIFILNGVEKVNNCLVSHDRISSPFDVNRYTNYLSLHKEPQQKVSTLQRGINGGIPCAACTILFAMGSQLAQVNNETIVEAMKRICQYMPEKYQTPCEIFVSLTTPLLLKEFVQSESPDVFCYGLNVCHVDENEEICHLFPLPKDFKAKFHQNSVHSNYKVDKNVLTSIHEGIETLFPWLCFIPGLKQLCEVIDDTYDKLIPGLDLDGDRYSSAETLRGSIWRGRDCSDINANYHPGRIAIDQDMRWDSNCNGIYGVNPESSQTYEDELCLGTGQRGLIYIGDSVGAHFHVPPIWFKPELWDSSTFANLSYVISNEGDWPDIGFFAGFRNGTYMPKLIYDDNVDSIYLRLRERNLCNHRDYQNLARNGADSNNTVEYVKSIVRSQDRSHPAIVFYSLVGNDVCTLGENSMTTPEKFYNNTITVLQFLDDNLPPDSHVILMGLVDGSIMYNAMAKRIHPLGELRSDLTYDDMYTWFNCMKIGPCSGWMNRNGTERRRTTKRANQLSKVLKTIATMETFSNFDLHFVKNPFRTVLDEWADQGGDLWELIEPVDSLHPNQKAQRLIAEALWNHLEKKLAFVLGPVNRHNDRIRELFGDQGGH